MKRLLAFLFLGSFGFLFAGTCSSPTCTPPTCPTLNEKIKHPLSFWGEYYFWQGVEGGLGYVYNEAAPLVAGRGINGDLIRGTFNWHSGFRVGMSYAVPSAYTVELQFANFDPSDHKGIHQPEGDELRATFPNDINIYLATSYVSLKAHFGDILLKKKWHAAHMVDITLFTGFSLAWMTHNWKVEYFNDQSISRAFKTYWHYKGGGPKMGVLVDWLIGNGFSFAVKGSIVPLYGNYDNDLGARDKDLITHAITILARTHTDDFRIVMAYNFLIGPAWEKVFKGITVRLYAAYELNSWYNASEIHRQIFYAGQPHTYALPVYIPGVMSTQGVTLGSSFSF